MGWERNLLGLAVVAAGVRGERNGWKFVGGCGKPFFRKEEEEAASVSASRAQARRRRRRRCRRATLRPGRKNPGLHSSGGVFDPLANVGLFLLGIN